MATHSRLSAHGQPVPTSRRQGGGSAPVPPVSGASPVVRQWPIASLISIVERVCSGVDVKHYASFAHRSAPTPNQHLGTSSHGHQVIL